MSNNDKIPQLKLMKPIGGFHGVSAVFPKLKDIIDYEEKNIIINQGYPRFVTHPVVKCIEAEFKKKYNAIGAISCHSYESAVFLVIDYFFKEGNKIFYDKGLPIKFYNFLNKKFPNHVVKSDIYRADILFLSKKKIKLQNSLKSNRIFILLNEDDEFAISSYSNKFDILIHHDKSNDIGIILIYDIKYAILEILRRHCGFNVSSRKLRKKKGILIEKIKDHERNLKKRISELEHSAPNNCFLYPSGMAALFSSILSLLSFKRPKIIALGSLYVDTIRILEKWPKKYNLMETLFIRKNIEDSLENLIDNKTAGVIVEIPSNPLIQLIDVEKIVKIAHEKNVKVIVDNTIATPYNFNPFNYNVDIIVHSTTKFLSGKNNHIGGVVLTNDDNFRKKIKLLNNLLALDMDFNEIKTLSRNLRKFEERMKIINDNSKKIANFLNKHDTIKKVFYPLLENDPNNKLFKKYLKGGSGLISFILRESTLENAEMFYNNLQHPILRGPSLGSEKTLLSPYVIMAHFDDPKEDLKKLGFDFFLMRISVGIEPVEKIIKSLEHALNNIY